MPRTPKQIAASRANGRISRGPVTAAGKARSAHNALTHGLTSRQLCLADEDPAALDALRAAYQAEWQPATPTAHDLVDDLATTRWRLNRALLLEARLHQLSVTDNGPYLRKEWSNLQPLSAVALSLDHFDGRLHRVQAHIERLRRALHRTVRLLQQLAAPNAQNEPKDVQPAPAQALTPAPEPVSPAAPLPRDEQTDPSRSPQLPEAAAPRSDREQPATATPSTPPGNTADRESEPAGGRS